MLTLSISDEALHICSSEINERGLITAKPPIEGDFEKFVSSQRSDNFHHGDRGRGGDGVIEDQCLNACLSKHEIGELDYDRAFKHSVENPEQFWAEVGQELTWFKPWDKVLDNTNPPFTKWFVGGMLNACYNAVDRHVENGCGERVALIHDSPVTSTIRYITYSQLLQKVSLLAGVYSSIGVRKGDRVLIYMPMIPEAIISMLAAARLGAIHSVVFGGFAARELRTRIEHAEPTVIVAASCGVEPNKIVRYRSILQEALSCSHFNPTHVIMFERPEISLNNGENEKSSFGETIVELDWEKALQTAAPHECVPVEANDPLYILYTSGTTDQPKGVVRPVGGHLATLSWTMHAVYGMQNPKQGLNALCNGETTGKSEQSSIGVHEQSFSRKDTGIEQQQNNGVNNSSINEIDLKNDVALKKNLKPCSLVNIDAREVQKKQVKSNEKVNKSVDFMDEEGDRRCFSNLKEEREHRENNADFQEENPSKRSSNNILSKLCLKVLQMITGTKENKSTESISHNHTRSKEDLHELKFKEKKIAPLVQNSKCSSKKFLESTNHISQDELFTTGVFDSDNLLKIRACSLKDSTCKLSSSKTRGSKALKIPSMQSNCLTRNINQKSAQLTSKFPQMKEDINRAEISLNHTDCISNQSITHNANHFKIGKKKSDLNVDAREKYESNTKIKSKNSHQTMGNSYQLPKCKNKNTSQNVILNEQLPYHQNRVWWAASDMGWVVGHSYVCYAPLTAGLTSVMYEGKPDRTPDPGQYFRVIEQHRVNAILTAPTALRVIKRVDPHAIYGKKYSTDSLETIFVAGESLDQSTKTWAERIFKVDVVNHWWQTETGHSITATCIGLGHSSSHAPGLSTGKPFPGFDLHILRDDGTEADIGEEGRIAARLPLPPGTLSTLYKDSKMFTSLYFSTYPGYYDTMDAGYIIPDTESSVGWVVVTGREDDVVSVAGHRLSASAIEAVALKHPDVSDALVVGAPDRTKGEVPLCLYVPTPDWKKDEEEDNDAAQRVSSDLIRMVRELVGPIAAFRLASPVPALPKTRSGKIPRKSVARMARGLPLKIPSTVEDPLVYEDIKAVLQRMRFSEVK